MWASSLQGVTFLGRELFVTPVKIVPNQVKTFTFRWKKQFAHSTDTLEQPDPILTEMLKPSAVACDSISQKTWSQSNRTHFTTCGWLWAKGDGCQGSCLLMVLLSLLVHSQQQTKAVPDHRTGIRLGIWSCSWRLVVNREISDWRLGVKKQRKRLGAEHKATASISVSHVPMQERMEEQGGHVDQKKVLREERSQGLAVPGDTAGISVRVKGKQL